MTRRPHVSAQGIVVVEMLATQPLLRLPIRRLVNHVNGTHGSIASTRASLSRTLRRLHQAGLVELLNGSNTTLSEYHGDLDAELAKHEADPEAAYAELVVRHDTRWAPTIWIQMGVDGYLEHMRRTTKWQKHAWKTTAVRLTVAGVEFHQAHAKRLTRRQRYVNRLPAGQSRSVSTPCPGISAGSSAPLLTISSGAVSQNTEQISESGQSRDKPGHVPQDHRGQAGQPLLYRGVPCPCPRRPGHLGVTPPATSYVVGILQQAGYSVRRAPQGWLQIEARR